MTDRITTEQRSALMSKIKGKNTGLELSIFRELRRRNVYFKRHYSKVPGSPDLALPTKKIAIFIDGDFWHGFRYPAWRHNLSTDFWREKIERNRRRDKRNFRKLKRMGWRVLRVWEHQILKDFNGSVLRIVEHMRG
ncbi:MAG: very short patch repair endonuclease [Patescibacteria group bacterium]